MAGSDEAVVFSLMSWFLDNLGLGPGWPSCLLRFVLRKFLAPKRIIALDQQ